jgi:ferric-dicitrate binding protein FerR (iron transport regulator)
MSSRPRLARIATDALARAPVDTRPPTAAERDAGVDAIAEAIARSRAKRVRARWMGGLCVAAAFAIVGSAALVRRGATVASQAGTSVGIDVHASGEATVVREGSASRLGEHDALFAHDRVVVADGGSAVMDLSTGTRIDLESGAEVEIVERGALQLFELRRGALVARVAKLGPAQRFVVRTSDAEIEVRGTAFRVLLQDRAVCGARTRLEVTEGVVVVRGAGSETRVRAGEHWPAECGASSPPAAARSPATPEAPAPPSAPEPRVAPTAPPEARASAQSPPPAPAAKPSPSELAAQNAAFADAIAARRRGDTRAALAGFDRFLASYPSSPLAESAAAERMRLLASSGDPRARDAAAAYLARYPGGFAREEAREILANRR